MLVRLYAMWRSGRLGGEVMPENFHPALDKSSDQLAAYFTLGMPVRRRLERLHLSPWQPAPTLRDRAARKSRPRLERFRRLDRRGMAGVALVHVEL